MKILPPHSNSRDEYKDCIEAGLYLYVSKHGVKTFYLYKKYKKIQATPLRIKIGRFPDKNSHQIFVEPEGLDSKEVYPSGVSTSLPLEIQKAYIHTIVGFENAIITQPGYAIEYDFVYPHQLDHTLEVKTAKGLFLAGQINGTTGYEEAACQGLMAGINAHHKINEKDEFTLSRSEAYIGVLIDDLSFLASTPKSPTSIPSNVMPSESLELVC